MKIKQLVKTASFLVALTILSAPTAQAITAAQARAVKKAVTSIPVPEMPAKAAELVLAADKQDREAVAVTAVRAIIFKHRAAAPLVVSAIAKVAPEVASAISVAATEMDSEQAAVIARAAAIAAPQQASRIGASVAASSASFAPVQAQVFATVNSVQRQHLAASPAVTGTVEQSNDPIGGGTFVGAQSNLAPAPKKVTYNSPRSN